MNRPPWWFYVVAFVLCATMILSGILAGRSLAETESPGGLRVVENDEWLLMREYVTAKGTVSFSGNYEIVSKKGNALVVKINWLEGEHTWVDVDIDD